MKGRLHMQQEQKSPVDKTHGSSPDPVDVFMERLIQRLTPLLMQQAVAERSKLVGMSWVLAMLSLIVLACMTYLFLSEGAAGISAGGVQLGAGLSPFQQLLGIGITSLATILVNIVFNVIAFRGKR
jgi:glycopeptide antibiotics resistance protein